MKHSFTKSGFSLVEVTLALGIAAFTMLAIFGLMPIGMNANLSSSEQTIAAEIATAVATDLRVAPTTGASPVSPLYNVPMTTGTTVFYLSEAIATGTTGFKQSVSTTNDSRYRVQVILAPLNNQAGSRTATVGSIVVSWPGRQNDLTRAWGTFRAAVALDRN